MRSIEALKEKARHHEQNEEWQPARDLYMKAIAAMDDEAQFDIGLYNRVGDILVKIGDYDSAVEHYEKATDLYLEAELPNNAIAVCKKVARHLPGRNEVYLRMGQIRASQGFLVDARENFLIYASKVEQAGDTEEALRALIEFAALAPEDTEIRLSLAQQLERHGRESEALEQLVAGYRVLRLREDDEQAAEWAERIRALDPEHDPDRLADALGPQAFEADSLMEDHGGGDSFEASFGEIELGGEGAGTATGPAPEAPVSAGKDEVPQEPAEPTVVEAEFGEIVVAPDDEEDEGAAPPSGDEGRAGFSSAGSDPAEPGDAADPVFEIGGDLPLVSFGEEEDEDGEGAPAETIDASAFDLTGEEEPELELDDDEGEDVPLPFLDLDDAGDGTLDGEGDLGTWEAGRPEDGGPAPSPGEPAPASWESLREAYDPVHGDVDKARELVEAAFQSGGESRVLVEAYELLARALEGAGDEAGAREVWAQIRALDPEHPGPEEVSEAAGVEPPVPMPEEPSTPETGAADEGTNWVDLGSLVFGKEEKEKTTRFQVAYQEPSGDEAADFADMLAQFKAKVAENFDASDVRAHHDLGTAYKEMGLLNEAVAEFQQALRASADHLPTYELLGQTFMERGEHGAAVRVLERALRIPSEVEDELIGIYYYLGRAHQELGQVDEALGFYDRVFALDINFADVTSRLRELR